MVRTSAVAHQGVYVADWERGEDSRAEALFYDIHHSRLVAAGSSRPSWWDHRAVQSDKGHNGRLCGALYNSAFDVVSLQAWGALCDREPLVTE